MRRSQVIVTGAGVSAPLPTNLNTSPFNIGLAGIVSSGATVSYTVQHTFDDVQAEDFDASTATWFNHEDIAGATANADGNYAFPVTAIRLNVASSDGTVTLVVIQAGIQ